MKEEVNTNVPYGQGVKGQLAADNSYTADVHERLLPPKSPRTNGNHFKIRGRIEEKVRKIFNLRKAQY